MSAPVSPAPSSTGSINASGTTSATTNACVTLPMYATTGGVSVTVSGTFSATLQPEQSGDGVNWSSAGLSTISAAGTTTYTTIGMLGFRIRASAYVSGTAVVTITAGGTTNTIASGTATLGTTLIASGAAASTVTVAATGVLATDNIMADFNGIPTGTVGYEPSSSGMLTIIKYPTAGNVNFIVVNNTGSSITPGAVTLNWRVLR